MTQVPPGAPGCLNCGFEFGLSRRRYCPECGQETELRPPTLSDFAQQFGGSYIAAEGALWRTLRLLFLKPGQLTCEYLAGRRRRYVLPLRLYLTISLVALLVMRVGSAVQVNLNSPAAIEIAKTRDARLEVDIGRAGFRAGLREGKFFCENLPGWFCQRLERRLDLDPKNVNRELDLAFERFYGHWGNAMFLLVPLFAAWLKLAYRNRRLRYTEHLVFALHLHAFWFAAILIAQLPLPSLADVAALAMPVYALLATHRVYGGRWWATLLRNAAVAVAYGLTLAVALGTVALWTLLS